MTNQSGAIVEVEINTTANLMEYWEFYCNDCKLKCLINERISVKIAQKDCEKKFIQI